MGTRKKSYRVEVIELLPWVRALQNTTRCEGYRWGSMPLKAVYGPDAKELKERYKCKNNAHWSYRTLHQRFFSGVPGKTGRYCWSHLPFDSMDEDTRIHKWLVAHEDQVEVLRAKHGLRSMSEVRADLARCNEEKEVKNVD